MTDEKELAIMMDEKKQSSNPNSIKSLKVESFPDPENQWVLRTLKDNQPCCLCIDNLRWKINLYGLYFPFGSCCKRFPFIARITVSDIIIVILLLLYMILPLLFYILNIENNDRFEIAKAFGAAGARNYILAILFTERNTIIRYIFGLPFERSIIYHQYIARFGILFTWIHMILMFTYWSDSNDLTINNELFSNINVLCGFIAFICLDIAAFTAHEKVREKCFELFIKLHWILIPTATILILFHNESVRRLFIGVICIHVIDILIRVISWCKPVHIIDIKYIENNHVIKIEWNKPGFKHIGGQYVFVCIPDISLTQWHPFSISSGSNDNNLSLHIKCAGDWCERLFYLIKEKDIIKKMNIYIEGPYGRLSIPFQKYSSIILVCGGIGITPISAIFSDLIFFIKKQKIKNKNISRIHFVWSVKTCHELKEFDKIHWNTIKKYTDFHSTDINDEIFNINNVEIKTSYFVTQMNDEDDQNEWKKVYSNLYFKRASIKKVIEEAKESIGKECIGIIACGPKNMLIDIRNQAAFNKIHCHTEIFGI